VLPKKRSPRASSTAQISCDGHDLCVRCGKLLARLPQSSRPVASGATRHQIKRPVQVASSKTQKVLFRKCVCTVKIRVA